MIMPLPPLLETVQSKILFKGKTQNPFAQKVILVPIILVRKKQVLLSKKKKYRISTVTHVLTACNLYTASP